MASIIGGFSKNNALSPLEKIPFSPTFSLEQKRFCIYATGNSSYHFAVNDKETAIVCGSGIENSSLMTTQDWQKYIQEGSHSKLNGHYLIIRTQENKMTIENDQLGLREMYFIETENAVYFSTRLDWIMNFRQNNDFNFKYLCSLWNFENPLLFETLVDNVSLLGAGGIAIISDKGLSISNQSWIPQINKTSIEEVIHSLQKLIASIIEKKKISLGFSGGIDSRTILALLLNYPFDSWETHTFGQKSNFDITIANAIAKKYNFTHFHHDIEPFTNDNLMGNWEEFVLGTNCFMPAHYYHEHNYYKILPKDTFFIDGGKGEYIRRGLSNRLAVLGKKALQENNIEEIKKYLINQKPNFFSRDVTKDWDISLTKQVDELMKIMPKVAELGVENWVDLYNIRYRTGNSSYSSQTRLDAIIPNLMPFIQPNVLNKVFNLSPKIRKRETINRKILAKHLLLLLFPLARYETVIPFQHNKFSSLIWAKLMRKMIKERDDKIHHFLLINKSYILSRLSDSDFINSSFYDRNKIIDFAKTYYKGDKSKANFLIWWLTFDKWYQKVNKSFDR
jgi:hypothetical protein